MCGIVGLFAKSAEIEESLGQHLGAMLEQMSDRGPDSAGVAVYRDPATSGSSKLTLFSADPLQDWEALADELRNAFGENVTEEMIYAAYNVGFGRFQSRDFLIEKTPATTQAACARLKQLIAAAASPAEKTTKLTTAE